MEDQQITPEEIQRIHKLANEQSVEFLFDRCQQGHGDDLVVWLKGTIKDGAKDGQVAHAPSSGEYNAVLQVPLPPKEIFQDQYSPDYVSRTLHEKQVVYMFDHAEYPEEGGIYRYFKGVKYPEKTFPFPEMLASANLYKRMLISQIKFFAKNPLAVLGFLKKSILEKWLDEQVQVGYTLMSPFYMQPIRYCKASRELTKFIAIFLNAYGITETIAGQFGQLIGHLIEADSAYRLRVNDLTTVTAQELLRKNPRKEFKKILQALKERDPRAQISEKFGAVLNLLSYALLIPKIRNAFNKALDSIDFTQIQSDEADKYHQLRIGGYNFQGRTIEDRIQEYIKIHDGNMPAGYEVLVK